MDPHLMVIEYSGIMKVFQHQGILGKGRDFFTQMPSLVHVLKDKIHNHKYALQVYEKLTNQQINTKLKQITKATFNYYYSAYCIPVCTYNRRINKTQNQLGIIYNVNNVFGMSLQNLITSKLKKKENFNQQTIIEYMQVAIEGVYFGGRFHNQYLDISPTNIFYSSKKIGGYFFYINNFGLNFKGTKWQKKYNHPADEFFNVKLNSRNNQMAVKSVIFMIGLTALHMATLQDTSQLYNQQQNLNQDQLSNRIKSIQEQYPYISQIIQQMCQRQSKRITINELIENKIIFQNVHYYDKKISTYLKFQGIINKNQVAQGFADVIYQNYQHYRGRLIGQQKMGFGTLQTSSHNYLLGQFHNNIMQIGCAINKSNWIYIGQIKSNGKGTMLYLKIKIDSDKKSLKIPIFQMGEFEMDENIESLRLVSGQVHYEGGYFQGNFVDGLKNGKGKEVDFRRGIIINGYWQGDVLQGQGSVEQNSQVYLVTWKDGVQTHRQLQQ